MGNPKGDGSSSGGYEKIIDGTLPPNPTNGGGSQDPKGTPLNQKMAISPKGTPLNQKMAISPNGLALIKHFEGCSLIAYKDSVGVPTIAWGRIKYPSGVSVAMGDTCTQTLADEWLAADVRSEGEQYVHAYLAMYQLNQDQYDALTSFTYNRGAGRLRNLINEARSFYPSTTWLTEGIAAKILTFNWAGNEHKFLEGLDRRRHAERELYVGGQWQKWDTVAKYRGAVKHK